MQVPQQQTTKRLCSSNEDRILRFHQEGLGATQPTSPHQKVERRQRIDRACSNESKLLDRLIHCECCSRTKNTGLFEL